MKFYAVRKGRTTGIFVDWEKCKESVEGFKGAEYKSFPELKYAQEYLHTADKNLPPIEEFINDDTLIAYCDGSSPSDGSRYGAGLVLLTPDHKIIRTINRSGMQSDMISMRNVAGEVLAASIAMQQTIRLGYHKLVIYHDYLGISKWCLGEWKANKTGTIKYKEDYQSARKIGLKIRFEKVKSHSGDPYNDLADLLAKESIQLASRRDVANQELGCLILDYFRAHDPTYEVVDMPKLESELIQYISDHSELQYDSTDWFNENGFSIRFNKLHYTVEGSITASKNIIFNEGTLSVH